MNSGDSDFFVGRDKELSLIASWLDSPTNRLAINFFGIGGVGKTKLARQVANCWPKRIALLDLGPSGFIHTPEQLLETIGENLFEDELLSEYHEGLGEIEYKPYVKFPNMSAKVYIEEGAIVEGDVKAEIKIKADKVVTKDERERRLRQHVELFIGLLAALGNRYPCIIIFDHFEHIENDKPFRNWILETLTPWNREKILKNIGVVFFSRIKVSGTIATQDIIHKELANFNHKESDAYLSQRGVINDDQKALIINITKGHPYSMFLATNLSHETLQEISHSPEMIRAETEEVIVAQFLVDKILEQESDQDVKKVLLSTCVLRVVNAMSVAFITGWKSLRANNVISKLEKRSFLTKISSEGYWVYHDLLRDLLLKNLLRTMSHQGYDQFHRKAIAYYKKIRANKDTTGIDAVISLIEPFYHLMEVNENEAWIYFETEYKSRLDRRERDICRTFISQIDFSKVRNPRLTSWFKFRTADFLREFGEYEKALQEYMSLLEEYIPEHHIQDAKLVTSILNNIGWLYLFYGPATNTEYAIEFLERALKLGKSNAFIHIVAMSLNNLGIAWERKGDYQKAEYYYKESLKITEQKKWENSSADRLVAGMSRQNLANLYADRNKYDEAKDEYNLAYAHYNVANSIHYAKTIILLYGTLLLRRREYDKALAAFLDTLSFWGETKDYGRSANTLFNLGICHEARNEIELLFQAHSTACQTSLFDSFKHHEELVVGGIAPFIRYLHTKRDKRVAKEYVERLVQEWNSQELLAKFDKFERFLNEQLRAATKIKYYSLGTTYHKIDCSERCKLDYTDKLLFFISKKTASQMGLNPCVNCKP